MSKIGKLIFLSIGLGVSNIALADWITLYLINDDMSRVSSGYSKFITCRYGDDNEYITIRVSDFTCPFSIEYNPEMNKWRK